MALYRNNASRLVTTVQIARDVAVRMTLVPSFRSIEVEAADLKIGEWTRLNWTSFVKGKGKK